MRSVTICFLTILFAIEALAQGERVVNYEIINAREIQRSLTGAPGDAENGRRLYFDRELTGCSGCHGSPGGPGAQASTGAQSAPPLKGVAGRLSEGALRLWVIAPEVLAGETEMPGYYSVGQRDDPNDPRYGEPRLSAQEIEDIVAYLRRQK